jgi:hypothetical protein
MAPEGGKRILKGRGDSVMFLGEPRFLGSVCLALKSRFFSPLRSGAAGRNRRGEGYRYEGTLRSASAA